MDLYILDSNYTQVAVIDEYKSLIWTKRYFTYGDFELYLPADKNLLQYLRPDYLVIREDDDSVMIIEKLVIQTDVENDDFFIVSGRSFESILLRRVFMFPFTIDVSDPIQGIKRLIDRSQQDMYSPSIHWRNIPELVVDDSFSIEENLKAQFTGDTLFDAISSISMRFGFGFKMTISNSQFILSFYQGERVDIVFSPEFDNLINSTFTYDKTNFATCIYVAGEGEGKNRKVIMEFKNIESPTDPSDQLSITLREVYVDARDLSSDDLTSLFYVARDKADNHIIVQGLTMEQYEYRRDLYLASTGITLEYFNENTNRGWEELSDPDKYQAVLVERADEKFSEHSVTKVFEAEIEPRMTFKYKEDYNLGDIVEVATEYGVTAHPRIVEIIESWDENGYTVIPTLEELEVE